MFGTQSCRSGGATTAENADVKERAFQRHGRWKTVKAKDGYVEDCLEARLAVSKSLNL